MNPSRTPSIDILCPPRECPTGILRKFAVEVLKLYDRVDAELCIAFTDDKEIQRLNREFRNIDSPTDVLSFPSGGENPQGQNRYLGDIAVSIPAARRQAKELGHSLRKEILILVAHGLLHLCGLDHEVDDGEMEGLETTVSRELVPKYC